MPYDITDHPDGSIARFHGIVLPAEIVEASKHMSSFTTPAFRWCVWDYGGINHDSLRFWDGFLISRLSEAIDPLYRHQTWPVRNPHVVTSDLVRSLVLEYDKVHQRPAGHEFKVFSTLDAALDWARGDS